MAVTPGLECGDDEFGNSNAYEGQEILNIYRCYYALAPNRTGAFLEQD